MSEHDDMIGESNAIIQATRAAERANIQAHAAIKEYAARHANGEPPKSADELRALANTILFAAKMSDESKLRASEFMRRHGGPSL